VAALQAPQVHGGVAVLDADPGEDIAVDDPVRVRLYLLDPVADRLGESARQDLVIGARHDLLSLVLPKDPLAKQAGRAALPMTRRQVVYRHLVIALVEILHVVAENLQVFPLRLVEVRRQQVAKIKELTSSEF